MNPPLFRDPLILLPGERPFFASVMSRLDDDLPKLVYADWLEEQGDKRGQFLRSFVQAVQHRAELPDDEDIDVTWLWVTGLDAVRNAWEANLSITPECLLQSAAPSLCFEPQPPDGIALPLTATKVGGFPDVPDWFEWPECEQGSLSFLAQFNLADLSSSPLAFELPSAGLLSVFHSRRGDLHRCQPGEWKVYYFHPEEVYHRHTVPAGLREHTVSPECRLLFSEHLDFPDDISIEDSEEMELYRKKVQMVERGHRLLGCPVFVDDSPAPDALLHREFATARHLLTLETDPTVDWEWGDDGALYFFVEKCDLKSGRFGRSLLYFEELKQL